MLRLVLTRVANVLLNLALERVVRTALPRVYKQLDMQMPDLLAHATPQQMEKIVADAIDVATKGQAHVTTSQVAAVIGLYSPIAATAKNLIK
jgi:hypothetical protein